MLVLAGPGRVRAPAGLLALSHGPAAERTVVAAKTLGEPPRAGAQTSTSSNCVRKSDGQLAGSWGLCFGMFSRDTLRNRFCLRAGCRIIKRARPPERSSSIRTTAGRRL